MGPALLCVHLLAQLAFHPGTEDPSAATGGQPAPVAVELTSLELTALSAKRSEARAVLKVSSPLPERVRVAESRFVLRVEGQEVGQGSSSPRRLRAHKASAVEVSLKIDRVVFLSALGGNFHAGMQVDAELSGALALRLPSGDLSVPLQFSARMGTDGARSGVFAMPEGGASLSPH